MKRLLLVCVLNAACYHNLTGLPPSQQVIKRQWAPSFVFGLIHPPLPDVKPCSSGVNQEEGHMNGLQWVVAIVTTGIYTPMQQSVTCAAKVAPSPSPLLQ